MANFTIPLGYKYTFEPTDSELLVYLLHKVNGEALPCERAIREIDLYGLSDPGKLFQGTEENMVYVFTKLKKVSKNGKRVDRTVTGNRSWKGVDGGKPIFSAQGFKIGEKKSFVMINKMKTILGYNMKEFTLDKDATRNSRFKDYVLCLIKKKDKKPRNIEDGNSSVSVDYVSESQENSEFPESISNVRPVQCGDFVNNQAPVASGFFEINEGEGYGQNDGGEVEERSEIEESWDMINSLLASTPNWTVSLDDIFAASSALPLATST